MNSLAVPPGGNAKRMLVTAPSLTQAVLDQGVVIAYYRWSISGNNPVPMPSTFVNASTIVEIGYRPSLNKVTYYFWIPASSTTPVGFGALGAGAQVRYIIIPGGVGGGRSAEKSFDIKGTVYTESELKAMPYQQICQLLNIPQ